MDPTELKIFELKTKTIKKMAILGMLITFFTLFSCLISIT